MSIAGGYFHVRRMLRADCGLRADLCSAFRAERDVVAAREQAFDGLAGFARIEVDRAHRVTVERKLERGTLVERAVYQCHFHGARRAAVSFGQSGLDFQHTGRNGLDLYGGVNRLSAVGGGQGVGAGRQTGEFGRFGRHVGEHLRGAAGGGREAIGGGAGRGGAVQLHLEATGRATGVGVADDAHFRVHQFALRDHKRARGRGIAVRGGGAHLIVAEGQSGEGVGEGRIDHIGRLQGRCAGTHAAFFPQLIFQAGDTHHFRRADDHTARTVAAGGDRGGRDAEVLHVDRLFPLVGAVFPALAGGGGDTIGHGAHTQGVAAGRQVEEERLFVGLSCREVAHRHGGMAGRGAVFFEFELRFAEAAHAREMHAHGTARGLATAGRGDGGGGLHVGRLLHMVDDFGQHDGELSGAAGGHGANVDRFAFVPTVEGEHGGQSRSGRHHGRAVVRTVFRHAVGHGREAGHGVAVGHGESCRRVAVAVGRDEGGGEIAGVERGTALRARAKRGMEQQHEEGAEEHDGRSAHPPEGGNEGEGVF